tara:strand:+ start:47 stop:346 length:300 start_codon:yes stop_codon:yes gene_type:complete
MTDIIKAIKAINPNAKVSVNAEDFEQITWHDGTAVISKADIQAKQAELQTAYDAEQWKRNRQTEYPSIDDCIHALLDGGDTLTNLQAKRTAVKDKYPKG